MYLPLLLSLLFSVSSLAQSSSVRENARMVGTVLQAPVQDQAPVPSPRPSPEKTRANSKSRKP